MMELGATVCLPQRPLCLQCPVQPFCATRGEHQAPPPKKMRSRQIAYALLRRDRAGITQVLLQRRPLSASLMPGMWELPEVAMQRERSRAGRNRPAPCHHRDQLPCSSAPLLRAGSQSSLSIRGKPASMDQSRMSGQESSIVKCSNRHTESAKGSFSNTAAKKRRRP